MTAEGNQSSSAAAPDRPACGLLCTLALAGIGLMSWLDDWLQSAYQRGAQRQSRGEQARSKRTAGPSQLALDEWEAILARLNLPSRDDIQALRRQIAALEEQIDQIAANRAASN